MSCAIIVTCLHLKAKLKEIFIFLKSTLQIHNFYNNIELHTKHRNAY